MAWMDCTLAGLCCEASDFGSDEGACSDGGIADGGMPMPELMPELAGREVLNALLLFADIKVDVASAFVDASMEAAAAEI